MPAATCDDKEHALTVSARDTSSCHAAVWEGMAPRKLFRVIEVVSGLGVRSGVPHLLTAVKEVQLVSQQHAGAAALLRCRRRQHKASQQRIPAGSEVCETMCESDAVPIVGNNGKTAS